MRIGYEFAISQFLLPAFFLIYPQYVDIHKESIAKIDRLRRAIVPNTIISRSQTVNILVNEKVEKLNGKGKEK